MNAFDGIIEDLNTADFDFLEKGLEPIQELNQTAVNYLGRINKVIKEYQQNGTIPNISFLEKWEEAKDDHKSATEISSERSSIKENIKPKETPPSQKQESPPRTRLRRNAFKEANQNTNQQHSVTSNTKLRQPPNLSDNFNNVFVKLEKLSICGNEKATPAPPEIEEIKVKTEAGEMPAPSRPAPRRKKRKGESKIQIKQEKVEEEPEKEKRDSDVVIEDVTLTIVSLVDSENEGDKTIAANPKEKRITKVKEAKKMKRSRTDSSEDEVKGRSEKRSKSQEEEKENVPNHTRYEDAASTLEPDKEVNNATFIASSSNDTKAQENMNSTVVVENPKYVKNLMPASVNDMMTDDESEEEVQNKSPPKPARTIPRPTKPIFSPFEQSPVKKKVQAFEKLKEEANALPPRITRTKTRAQAKEQEETDAAEATGEQKSNVKEKAKIFTPTASKFIPKASSTTMKSSRVMPPSSNESLVSAKSASALKASQAEFREREKKRREKEQEALKKREALLQAQIEEKKRKREEKQLKAQQQREALEKEKMKALETQKLKDERHKQLLAEQEERKQKQKEEAEKKRLMAKMRAVEEKKKEEEKRMEEQKNAEEMTAKLAKKDEEMARMLQRQKQRQMPIYMRSKAPYLPTPDCYDSDEEKYGNEVLLPDWVKERNLRFMQKCAFAAGEAIKNTFFSIQAQTPDLQDIFEVIEPQKLKRTSSAVWHKPPRFTMMPPGLEQHNETDDFYDD